ncbi:hypothetical protein NNJEOMEG_02605 [Fundidesulfovibrio magnetotacticus]|uniref:Lipoprotein n=1 Tax=Fundidesulfovibrio magnetotacticus TaxID=2730080 RepID=A0A6V8LWW3_9BACT|nr:hypothetical protein [Fundidesulfovibrio magnetotacticus]GFK94758.1 hypothetical protein NNJEOMEG_02605 [Fundidesulfovibrio magnetotacticus]
MRLLPMLLLVCLFMLSSLAACAVAPPGQPAAVVPAAQIEAANDYLGQSLINLSTGYHALLEQQAAVDPAGAARLQAQAAPLLTDLQAATSAYRIATAASEQIRADNPAVNATWGTALDAMSRVVGVVGPFALRAVAGH